MAELISEKVRFSGIKQPNIKFASRVAANKYEIDDNGHIIANSPVINAIDIDWNNAQVEGVDKTISSTTDLLETISDLKTNGGGSGDSNSIPIYDQETISELRNNNRLPSKYIGIENINSDTSILMIHQLMHTVTELQNEIQKLKNTFNRGIYSYNGEATYMSTTVGQYGDSEEPLWAIEESELDNIEGFDFDFTNTEIFNDDGLLKDQQHNRMFLYITASSSDIYIKLKGIDNNDEYLFNLSDYVVCNKCNIMIIISRKPDENDYPHNYVYLAVTDYVNNQTLKTGYLTNDRTLSIYESELNNKYYFDTVSWGSNNILYKFNIYVQDRTFGSEVIEATPDTEENSYRVAHIAVRSVKNYDVIKKIRNQLVNNEFIIDEEKEKLYLKINNKIINIGASNQGGNIDPDWGDDEIDTMTNQEIIKALYDEGIISISFKNGSIENIEDKFSSSNIADISLNKIGSFNMIHEESGKEFEFTTDAYGELKGKLLNDSSNKSLSDFITEMGVTLENDVTTDGTLKYSSYRGVMSQIGIKYTGKGKDKDQGLWSDRLKIGSIYAPLDTDIIHGCSHAYVELENTSDKDINLTGCYLHYIRINDHANPSDDTEDTAYVLSSLPLTGVIKGGSTYLIRGKQYVDNDNDINCFIKVNDYDQEWYYEWIDDSLKKHKDLIDFTIHNGVYTYNGDSYSPSYIFVLSYGNIINLENNVNCLGCKSDKNISPKLKLMQPAAQANQSSYTNNTNAPNYYPKGFMDAIAINSARYDIPGTGTYTIMSNSIYKNTFELDPAKQAFNALSKIDSSRQRWQNADTDLMTVCLNNRFIEFPKSEEKYDVTYFAPKASYQNKNVCTDKTKFNKEKPNAVTVAFGENIYTTRCFNWLSGTSGDEYVWIYDNNDNLIKRFESYKYTSTDIQQATTFPRRKEFPAYVNNIVYCDYRTNDVIDRSRNNLDVTYKEYAQAERACGLFAATKDFYVSHKCIIEFEAVSQKTTYKYIVGKSDKYGNPILEHCSEKRIFNIYPDTYMPKIYQITDQQGFHWIEYQVWAAAAVKLNAKIESDVNNAQIIPIIVNTGDATQAGARVNEWLDYFNAGDVLFNHFEQNNIVGNNDLNGTDIQFLGTGDDPGKSNGYYFYLFNCNEANKFFTDTNGVDHYAIVNNVYVPSLYYIQTKELRLMLMNSEITTINCRDWYNLRQTSGNYLPINIYTGWPINENGQGTTSLNKYYTDNSETYSFNTEEFVPIYTLTYHALKANIDSNDNHKVIAFCHEMPFTVITKDSLSSTDDGKIVNQFRSMSTASKLIGSHMNQIDQNDNNVNGIYWFSRLLEYMHVNVCIGGHKHTYAITYPLRENYKYSEDNGATWKYSRINGPMNMGDNLSNDILGSTILWSWIPEADDYQWNEPYVTNQKLVNFSKFPLTYIEALNTISEIKSMQPSNMFLPSYVIDINDANKAKAYTDYSNSFVTYIMCQATGYKFSSNKELPSNYQKFSRIIPKTNAATEKPAASQKFPMFGIYELQKSGNQYKLDCKIGRIHNIFNSGSKFTQYLYSPMSDNMTIQYIIDPYTSTNKFIIANGAEPYGGWVTSEQHMFEPIILS